MFFFPLVKKVSFFSSKSESIIASLILTKSKLAFFDQKDELTRLKKKAIFWTFKNAVS